VPVAAATTAAHLPPVSTLFAAFLGDNPVRHLVGPAALAHLSAAQRATLLGHGFFPRLIAGSFRSGLRAALDFAIVASLLAAYASWSRGKRYVHPEPDGPESVDATDGPPMGATAVGVVR
jgi:hypothetical protein